MYRVNAGGPEIPALDSGGPWTRDQNVPFASPWVNAEATSDQIFSRSAPVGAPHSSVPAYVPLSIFDDERWDPGDAIEMQWEFPVPSGLYRVHLFMMEGYAGTQYVGARKINVKAEGVTRLANYDIYALYGGYTPAMETFDVAVSDGSLSVLLEHVADDPAIRGIEIIALNASGFLGVAPSSLTFGQRLVGTLSPPQDVTITNIGGPGDPVLHLSGLTITPGWTHNLSPQSLAPGESRTFQVRFAPTATGLQTGTMSIGHDGSGSPVTVALTGTGANSFPVGFGKSQLAGGQRSNPTSLQFGPDGRLYVACRDGRIWAHTVVRSAANSYAVAASELIEAVNGIPNHNDDGTPAPSVTNRIITGILLRGTPTNPVIWVTSSDPRMAVANDTGLDTNSGILSRLDWNGSSWVRTDVVRGLPRSEDDHMTNGMALDTLANVMYIGQGGSCNMGAPSLNFSFLPEYALTGAILSVDLDAIVSTPYDIPTLDDEDRPGVNDANDPFGGNDGKNQARIVPGGPVQVHSPGWRNPYDVLIHTNGHLYSIDNGPNAGWGGPPVGAGYGTSCTNANNDNDSFTYQDNMHMIPGPGYYAGHPNPTRASTANTFNASNPQSPVAADDPRQCEYLVPGFDGSIARWWASTNGIVEYRASNFGNGLKGAVLAASFDNGIHRIDLNAAGDSATASTVLFSNVDVTPLDVTAQADDQVFRGTIWTCDYVTGQVYVFEPSDYEGGGSICNGTDSPLLDEDGDGFSNADEIDNATNPCSAGDQPADFDADLLSDLNDPDDDNDGLLDVADAFARDAANGATTTLPIVYTWDGGNPGNGLFGLGFTGLMANGTTDYLQQYDPVQLTPGGAAGKLTVDNVPLGDALGTRNTQQYAFQFGLAGDSTTTPFTAHTRLSKPFFNGAPADSMSEGLFVGSGTQSDWLSVAFGVRGGQTVILATHELADVPVTTQVAVPITGATNWVDLFLDVNPQSGTVQPRFQVEGGALQNAGPAIALPYGSALERAVRSTPPLAVGILATARGAAPFVATWDHLHVTTSATTGVEGGPAAVLHTQLLPSAPHPARGGTSVRFALATAGRTTVSLYGVDGRAVRQLADGWLAAGVHAIAWDGRDERGGRVAPGVYFLRLQAGTHRETARLVVVE
ncbi:MAG: choice-of-anchor D domain-containing protein [Candidatus Eisenbacteria bacterium]